MRNRHMVFFLIWAVLNRSRTLTSSVGSSDDSGDSCLSMLGGRSLPFALAAFSRITMTSWVRPRASSHLGDSGMSHLGRTEEKVVQMVQYCHRINDSIILQERFDEEVTDLNTPCTFRLYLTYPEETF